MKINGLLIWVGNVHNCSDNYWLDEGDQWMETITNLINSPLLPATNIIAFQIVHIDIK